MSSGGLKDFVQEQKSRSTGIYNPFSKFQGSIGDFRSKISINGLSSSLSSGFLSTNASGDDRDALLENGESSLKKDQNPSKSNSESQNGNSTWSLIKNGGAFGLTRTQRVTGFFLCFFAGLACFGLAVMYIPMIVFKARKFGALYTLGSCFFLFSFSLLWGPKSYAGHLFSQPRLPVTLAYFFSLFATLYCSLWIRSTLLTIVCASIQGMTLLWFLVSYIPGGETGLKFLSGTCKKLVCRQVSSQKSMLPV